MTAPDGNLQRSIGRMEGKMDALLVSVGQIGAQLQDHDGRIRKLEEADASTHGSFKVIHALWMAAAGILGALFAKLTGIHV